MVPGLPLKRSTWPPPTATVVNPGTVPPARKSTTDAVGLGWPEGWAVRYPSVVVLVTVRFMATAVTSAGIPWRPPIASRTVLYGATFWLGAPTPVLVSRNRVGPCL